MKIFRSNKHLLSFILILFVTVFFLSCSTKKNTASTRGYHQLTTMYNVYFNANLSYIEGMKSINNGHDDDFSRIIPMFAISNVENRTKATSQMDKVIEKCRKAIKKHSITKKPAMNKTKWHDPKYKVFYNQDEFVPGVKRSWITLGKAEYHKGDFIGAVGTFMYIARHYPKDANILCEARMWCARSYAELGWIYEAEEVLSKIKENDVHRKLIGDYAATRADIYMKQSKYAEAYPYLELAAKHEKKKIQRTRYYYILGQLSMEKGDKEEASGWFKKVKKSAPPYIMDFNTRLNIFSAESTNQKKTVKGLLKMAKHPNNLEYLDQVYHTLGDVYLANGDTVRAIDAYKKGAIESTRNGKDKAMLLIRTGDLYLGMKDYEAAYPCFQEANGLITVEHPDYRRVEKYATVLADVAVNYNMVELQDSLQHLSTLSYEEQLEIVGKVIEQVIADEEEAARLAKEAESKNDLLSRRASGFGGMAPPAFGNAAASKDWYFYNDNLKKSGYAQFQQKWGKRVLEDNWRRQNKTTSAFSDNGNNSGKGDDDGFGDDLSVGNDSSTFGDTATVDNKNPEFYLSQIPATDEDFAASNKLIAEALYALGDVYMVGLEDYAAALAAYEDYARRFGNDSLMIEVLYSCYRICGKTGDESEQDYYKQEIISKYPQSTYAQMLSQPDYVGKMKAMFAEQDSIYNTTYEQYCKGDFAAVRINYDYMQDTYPLSELMPKFALLNALSVGRTREDTVMYAALTDIVTRYPNSDVATMSKDILALMSQGKQAQQGQSTNTLASKRVQADSLQTKLVKGDAELNFVHEESVAFELHIVPRDQSDTALNIMLYDIAFFNFTKFLVKDYDIAKETIDGKKSIRISNIINYGEVLWYETMLLSEPLLQGKITLDVCERVIISEDNLKKILQGLNLEDYKKFFETISAKEEKK